MSIVYSTTVRNNRLQQVINAIDGGAGAGKLQIGTAGMALILSSIVLNKPSATISNGVLTFSNTPLTDGGAAATGLAVAAQIVDSAGNVIASGLTVGTVGTDVIISSANISAGDVVTLTSGTITGN